jgi:sugar phosphate isomerase/epimerase
MKIGWCGGLADAGVMQQAGLDFIELPLSLLGLENEQTLAAAKRSLHELPLPALAFNTLFPRDLRVVGPEVDEARVRRYLGRGAEVMSTAGARVVVYGSGWARNAPQGCDRKRTEAQFLQSLHWCAEALAGSGVTLVIEPLNRRESDLVNSVAEGVRFAQALNRPEVRVLADFYHMDEEHEPLDALQTHIDWLAHIHLADSGRRNPGTGTYDYAAFFGFLKDSGYQGMLSVECVERRDEPVLRHSLEFLKQHWH